MGPGSGFSHRPGGYFFILGVSLFAVGLAVGGRALWIVGLCLMSVGLAASARRPGSS
jgi:hypothetical protein